MANNTKKATSKEKEVPVVATETVTTQEATDVTDSQIAEKMAVLDKKEQELNAKLAEIDKALASMATATAPVTTTQVATSVDYLEGEIHPNKKTSISSLTYGALHIKNTTNSDGMSFADYGDVKKITYQQLNGFFNEHRAIFTNGYIYIHDYDMVKALNLESVYDNLFDKNVVDSIFKGDYNGKLELLASGSETQKHSFAHLMAKKVFENDFGDFNIVKKCSDITGIDIDALVKEMQEHKEYGSES